MSSHRARAVFHALLPAGEGELPGLVESNFEDFLARFSQEAHWRMLLGWRLCLWVTIWLSPVLVLRLPPISMLSARKREQALEALSGSRFYLLRQVSLMIRLLAFLHYGALQELRQSLGVPYPSVGSTKTETPAGEGETS